MAGKEQVSLLDLRANKQLTRRSQIIRKALTDLKYVGSLHGRLGGIVAQEYIKYQLILQDNYTCIDSSIVSSNCLHRLHDNVNLVVARE